MSSRHHTIINLIYASTYVGICVYGRALHISSAAQLTFFRQLSSAVVTSCIIFN